MADIPGFDNVQDIGFGISAKFDAWLLHFLSENHIHYSIEPDKNASPEQLNFMVCLDEKQVFAPCSDQMLGLLLNNWLDPDLGSAYNLKWRSLKRLVDAFVDDPHTKELIIDLCLYKFKQAQSTPIIIPSRLMKRFLSIFLTIAGLDDPFREIRRRANKKACRFIGSNTYDRLINACPPMNACTSLNDLRSELNVHELTRLLVLSTKSEIWHGQQPVPVYDELHDELESLVDELQPVRELFAAGPDKPLRILFIPDASGGLMFDLKVIQALLRQGHRVILALKEGFYFRSPAFWDWEGDPFFAGALEDAHFLDHSRVTKNELLDCQRKYPFVVISDGTREELNLYRASVTFARAWKESDLIMAKGIPQRQRLVMNSNDFTRDILCYWRDEDGKFCIKYKVKPANVRKFSESDLLGMAERIINEMRAAKNEGRTVVFYSAIVGSIPGETQTAIKVLDTFTKHLRERMEDTYIINPAEHFHEGMDADDLMFMWEKVQRSGMLDVWRFQTVADIERSFELMNRKVPPFWAGKDSTYSTGCTKEMHIALDVQHGHPEMKIIGPPADQFFRRREYGVGKFVDSTIE